jgi:hypothetical protein
MERLSAHRLAGRVRLLGPLDRESLLAECGQHEVGLAAFSQSSHNDNLRHLWGASNKVFDYLASGLIPLVSDDEQWKELVMAELALPCDTSEWRNVATVLRWCAEHRDELFAFRSRALLFSKQVCYETQFEPVINAIQRKARPSAAS